MSSKATKLTSKAMKKSFHKLKLTKKTQVIKVNKL